jgi:predicted enzyme related to lactoylglutathione lyase
MDKNVISWVEIPVKDMERAKKFYQSVFNKELMDYPIQGMEMAVFPMIQGGEFAMGSLVKSQIYKPSSIGTIVYFSCEDVGNELGRVEHSGGKVLMPKTSVGENGFIAHFMDTEGNRIGLHSMK